MIFKTLQKHARFSALALTGALLLPVAPLAQAQSNSEVVLESVDRESVNNPKILSFVANRFKIVGNSYLVRTVSAGPAAGSVPASRPYYTFKIEDAGGQQKPLVKATLTFFHSTTSVDPVSAATGIEDSSETMTFYSVDNFKANQLRDLREPLKPGTEVPATPFSQAALDNLGAIFADLGDGTVYGTLTASTANNGKFQTITLNEDAIRDLRRALDNGDKNFVIGGDLTSRRAPGNGLRRGVQERIFRAGDNTGETPTPQIKLTLTFGDEEAPSVAPALGGLFGLGFLGTGLGGVGLLGLRRRKR